MLAALLLPLSALAIDVAHETTLVSSQPPLQGKGGGRGGNIAGRNGGTATFENNDWDYCTPSTPCTFGKGDCDSDADCVGTLHCEHDVRGRNIPGLDTSTIASVVDVCYTTPPADRAKKPWKQKWASHGPYWGAPANCHCNHQTCQSVLPNNASLKKKRTKWIKLCRQDACCGCAICDNNDRRGHGFTAPTP
jgi:hypothetical protein